MVEELISSNFIGNNVNYGMVSGIGGVISLGKGIVIGGMIIKIIIFGILLKVNEVVLLIWLISGFLLIVSIGLGKLFFKNKKD